MTITVNDPGFKDGREVKQNYTYYIEILDDGVVTQTITVYPHYHWIVLSLYAAVHILLFMAAFAFSTFDSYWSWGGVVVSLQLVHLALSIKSVNADELGAVLFAGEPVCRVSGLTLVPLGLFTLVKLPKKLNQVQFPGDPEKVWKASDEEYFKLPPEEREKFVLPIRALTAAPEDESKATNVLESQMTLEVNFYVKWTVEQFWIFFVRIGTIKELERQLRDSGERVIIQEIATRTPQTVQKELSQINDRLSTELNIITHDSGIIIDEVAMLSPDLTHKVNEELRNIATTKAKAKQAVAEANGKAAAVKITAEAEQVRLTREGKGTAAATEAAYKALGKGGKALGLTPSQTAELEKARAFAKGNATVIVDGGKGANSLTGLGTRIAIGSQIATRKE